MKHGVGWELKIETGPTGQIVAVASLSGELTVSVASEIKAFFSQLLEAECDSKLVLSKVKTLDSSFFQLWYSFARASVERSFCTQLDLSESENVLQHAQKTGFGEVALFQQCLLAEDEAEVADD